MSFRNKHFPSKCVISSAHLVSRLCNFTKLPSLINFCIALWLFHLHMLFLPTHFYLKSYIYTRYIYLKNCFSLTSCPMALSVYSIYCDEFFHIMKGKRYFLEFFELSTLKTLLLIHLFKWVLSLRKIFYSLSKENIK